MGNSKITINAKTFHDHDKDLIYVDVDSLVKAAIFGIDSNDNKDKTGTHMFHLRLVINALFLVFDNDKEKVRKYLCKIDHIFDDFKF